MAAQALFITESSNQLSQTDLPCQPQFPKEQQIGDNEHGVDSKSQLCIEHDVLLIHIAYCPNEVGDKPEIAAYILKMVAEHPAVGYKREQDKDERDNRTDN